MASALVLGGTGLVGSFILSNLRTAKPIHFSSIEIIARRSPPVPSSSSIPVHEFIERDTSKWAAHISSLSPPPSVLFSSLATTRTAAGGFDNQYKLEHDLNIELAKAAKEAGTKTYVLISSTGADTQSSFGYTKMKGQIEEDVKDIGFDHTIIIRPGLIIGRREESRLFEGIMQGIASGMGKLNRSLKDVWAQDADVIAKAAVSAALKAERGEVKDKVWLLGQKEIVQLGSKEWKDLS